MAKWKLRFPVKQITDLVREYEERGNAKGEDKVTQIGLRARKAGHFSHDDFLEVCKWKTRGRSLRYYSKNEPEEVVSITRLALKTPIERLRIGALMALDGIGLPTASALLHLGHAEPYPIWDRRALWSFGLDKTPPYTFEYWKSYVGECRRLSQTADVDIRTLDRALWQYSESSGVML